MFWVGDILIEVVEGCDVWCGVLGGLMLMLLWMRFGWWMGEGDDVIGLDWGLGMIGWISVWRSIDIFKEYMKIV